MGPSHTTKNSTDGKNTSPIKLKLSTDDRKSKSGSGQLSLANKGTKIVRTSNDENNSGMDPYKKQSTSKSSYGKNSGFEVSSTSSIGSKLSLKKKTSVTTGKPYGHRKSQSKSVIIPAYLDPQPKFFVTHLNEDMVIENFDPLADSADEAVVESIVSEYSEDFDYESLYTTELEVGDNADDFIPALATDSQSASNIQGNVEEEDQQTAQVIDIPAVEETLSDCDDRSDEEIARDRAMKDLYDKAFSDIQAIKTIKVLETKEPPSITQKTFDEYFIDREQEKINKYKDEYSGWFFTEGSEVLYRRRIIACLDSVLVKERIKYANIKDEFKDRWETGQGKQVVVDQALVKFDGYYKETLTKRNRAVRQTTYEMSQRILKMHEINRFKKELDCLLRLQEECDKRLARFRIFERYLERVRDESHGEFSDIRDIIDRYGVLSQARNGLITRDLRNQDTIERAQHSLNRTVELRSNELLVYNNYLSELRVYRDHLQEEILQLEEILLHIKTTAAGRTLLIGQIKLAINNLYLGLCKQIGRAGKIPAEDTFRQLNYIKSSMKEIIKLNRDVKLMLKAAATAGKDAREKARVESEGRRRKYKYAKSQPTANDVLAIFGYQNSQPWQ